MIEYPLEKLMKHRRKMLLLDHVVSYDDNSIVAEVTITLQSTFLNKDHVPAWVGVEYAAQAVAAYSGLRDVLNDKETRVGLLLSCRRYKSKYPRFMLGDVLTIHAQESFNDGQMGAYNCSIWNLEDKIASVSLNAYVPENLDNIQ